jgi:hypothetical protein
MKNLLIAAMLLVISLPTVAQEIKHAPTLDACQADFNLWMADINRASHGGANEVSSLSFNELFTRVGYIHDCQDANPSLKKNCNDEGLLMEWIYGMEMRNRLLGFVKRHSLKETFLDEDAARKR